MFSFSARFIYFFLYLNIMRIDTTFLPFGNLRTAIGKFVFFPTVGKCFSHVLYKKQKKSLKCITVKIVVATKIVMKLYECEKSGYMKHLCEIILCICVNWTIRDNTLGAFVEVKPVSEYGFGLFSNFLKTKISFNGFELDKQMHGFSTGFYQYGGVCSCFAWGVWKWLNIRQLSCYFVF